MSSQASSWEILAAAKRVRTLDRIPRKWRLSPADLERAAKQQDLTGFFIQQFLGPDDIATISKNSAELALAI